MQYSPDQILVLPIALRDGVVVRIHIPANLTKDEAERVGNVVKAMAIKGELR